MDDRLERARKILLHPNFNKLSQIQIQQVFKSLLASGITKDDIETILNPSKINNITYLEKLPYDVFINLILTGNIEGLDLIHLCNSSPLINEKCNKDFNAEGKIIPLYLFYLLLKKLEVNVDKIKMDYRKAYIRFYKLLNQNVKGIYLFQNGRYLFKIINEDYKLDDLIYFKTQGMFKLHTGRVARTIHKPNLLEILWNIKINMYVLVTLYENGNILLMRLIKDQNTKIFIPQTKEVIILNPDLDLNNPIKIIILKYDHIYPEIVQWLFKSEIERLTPEEFNILQNVIFNLYYQNELDKSEREERDSLLPIHFFKILSDDRISIGSLNLLKDDIFQEKLPSIEDGLFSEDILGSSIENNMMYNKGRPMIFGKRFGIWHHSTQTSLATLIFFGLYFTKNLEDRTGTLPKFK